MIDFKKEIAKILYSEVPELEIQEITEMIEIPPDSKMGDFAFPCFKLAKLYKKAPPMIAKEIADKVKNDMFDKVENINGYINFYINKAFFQKAVLEEVYSLKEKYGSSDIGKGEKVIVEYSSPNIGKIFHFGHLRSTVIGNSLANILEFEGYDVFRLNYIGDWGTQFGKLIAAFKKWGNKELLEQNPLKTLLDLYVRFSNEEKEDPTLTEEARIWFKKLEDKDEEATELWQWFREESLKEYKKMYDKLNVRFDSFEGEAFYNDKMDIIVKELEEKELLKESEGAQVVFLDEYDMIPVIIKQKNGATLYATRDLASIKHRIENYKVKKSLYVVGSEQALHFKQIFKVAELLGYEEVKGFKHIDFGLVVDETGQKLGTRKGNSVFLKDVIDESVEKVQQIIQEKNPDLDDKVRISEQIGIGAIIFNDLKNNRIKNEMFTWEDMLNFEGETGPYVQYTHARASSILRNAKVDIVTNVDFSILSEASSYELCKSIYELPEVIADAAAKYEPSIITRHIVDLAQAFNRFYHEQQIIVEDKEVQQARLLMVYAAKQAISNGLKLLGMEAPERM
ncbi:MAG: arginine--tRNA ligase [Clostridiales bacterium]|nr:arginine--tRNA ligase [Clostridiales bacterium]